MKAQVRLDNQTPVITADGERLAPAAFVVNRGALSGYSRELFEIPGMRIFSTPCALREVWQDGGTLEFESFDRAMLDVLERAPEGCLLVRINLDAPEWWEAKHPEELHRYAPGSGAVAREIFEQTFQREVEDRETEHQSFASRLWREEAGAVFRDVIRHAAESAYGERILGYHVCAGWGNEWLYPGVFEGRFADYSRPMELAFREWLRNRYETDDQLRKAWRDESATIESAEIPAPGERREADLLSLKDPASQRPVIDFLECFSDVMADALLHFAGIVKEEAPDRLCSAYYGYLAYGGMFPYTMQNSGHRALQRVLRSDRIDILAAPAGYNDRYPGGDCTFMSVVESVRRHGKVWMNEDDTRVEIGNGGVVAFGGAGDIETAVHLHRRNAAASAVKGVGLWWIDFGRGWYDDSRVIENLAGCAQLLEAGNAGPAWPPCEIAVVLDDRSALFETLGDDFTRTMVTKQISRELGRVGAPYDLLHLDDIDAETCRYRLYIFLGCHHMSGTQVGRVHQTVERDGVTSLWVYAPGIFGGEGDRLESRAERISRVTGIRVGIEPRLGNLSVRLTDLSHPVTVSYSDPIRYGTDRMVGPVVYGDDPDAKILGEVEYLHTFTRPGLLEKEFDSFRSVYSSAFNMPAPLLRGIARRAGAHVYSDTGDIFHAGRGFVSIHGATGGMKTISLPTPARVVDFFEDRVVAEKTDRIEFELEKGRTKVFAVDRLPLSSRLLKKIDSRSQLDSVASLTRGNDERTGVSSTSPPRRRGSRPVNVTFSAAC